MDAILGFVIWGVLVVVTALSAWKWLRVAQREHYEVGRVTAIETIWLKARPINAALLALILVLFGLSLVWPALALVALVLACVWPYGLAVFTRRTPLVVTSRVKRLLAVLVLLVAILLAVAWLMPVLGVLLVVALPVVTDLALLITRPWEAALSKKFVTSAQRRLDQVHPMVVAITGSYGKTSTKNYAGQLISGSRRTLISPASFNNLLGLSKSVNDGLVPGIEVFIAEMGTYGPGEIRRLCELFTPSIAAITTIGEAHLERMGTRATIVAAKSEILETARTAVLNVDVPELAQLADQVAAEKTVLRCSARAVDGADVAVIGDDEHWRIYIAGQQEAEIAAPTTGHSINLAVAIALAVAVGVQRSRIVSSLARLSQPTHRAEVTKAPNGTVVIDDTYNANPDGAAAALRSARDLAGEGATVWTITPGMIELGSSQRERNTAFAKEATAAPGMRLVVTGFVNRSALLAGVNDASRVDTAKDRESAMRIVERDLAPGDVVLYENDLPSHYP